MAVPLPSSAKFNHDESKVPPYTLPDVLADASGRKVTSAEAWLKERRPQIIKLLEERMFGRAPALPATVKSHVSLPKSDAVDGLAVRHQVTLILTDNEKGSFMDVLVYLPKNAKGPAPLFWGLNFDGNHTVEQDPAIPVSRSLLEDEKLKPGKRKTKTETERGTQSSRYPLQIPLQAGFGVATCCYHDIDPDHHDDFKNGIHAAYPAERNGESWGSIAAWAWGMRVGLNYFQTVQEIDGKKVICMGHSRLGKTALWAGAMDERFALVISNNSGCGGAALNRRWFGETVDRINSVFPHWFCKNFHTYNNKESEMPWDQHWLIAAMAPRPVLIHSATKDAWADPKGEFLAGYHANSAYDLFGKKGLPSDRMPAPDLPVGAHIGYLLRTGEHEVTAADWKNYVDFAKTHLTGILK